MHLLALYPFLRLQTSLQSSLQNPLQTCNFHNLLALQSTLVIYVVPNVFTSTTYLSIPLPETPFISF